MSLSADERRRYSRQVLLPEFGEAAQDKLKAARVLIVGAGGLGSPAALYLAAAGIGTLGLVDFDAVDESNLQRQVLYGTADVGRPKLAAAAQRLGAANPYVRLELHEEPFGVGNARRLVEAYDVVIDGTDNFPTRYLVNDACVMARRPSVYGSVFRFEGQVAVFAAPGGPCYRCLHPEPPPAGVIPNCAEAGVLGVLPGVIGLLQATEAIKLVTKIGETLVGRLLLYDALSMRVREISLARDSECPVCGDRPSIRALAAYDVACDAPAPRGESMTVQELKAWRDSKHPHFLLDVREPAEYAICHIDGALLIPLSELVARVDELPADQPIVVQCKVGGRSAQATAFLQHKGFDAHNLTGGILKWIADIDPSLQRY